MYVYTYMFMICKCLHVYACKHAKNVNMFEVWVFNVRTCASLQLHVGAIMYQRGVCNPQPKSKLCQVLNYCLPASGIDSM